jgi:hypothetical protein
MKRHTQKTNATEAKRTCTTTAADYITTDEVKRRLPDEFFHTPTALSYFRKNPTLLQDKEKLDSVIAFFRLYPDLLNDKTTEWCHQLQYEGQVSDQLSDTPDSEEELTKKKIGAIAKRLRLSVLKNPLYRTSYQPALLDEVLRSARSLEITPSDQLPKQICLCPQLFLLVPRPLTEAEARVIVSDLFRIVAMAFAMLRARLAPAEVEDWETYARRVFCQGDEATFVDDRLISAIEPAE